MLRRRIWRFSSGDSLRHWATIFCQSVLLMVESLLKQLHQRRDGDDLGQHGRQEPFEQVGLDVGDSGAQSALDLADLELDLLDLLLQAQLGLTDLALGGQIRDLREARFEGVEGLGDEARAGLVVGRFRELCLQVQGCTHWVHRCSGFGLSSMLTAKLSGFVNLRNAATWSRRRLGDGQASGLIALQTCP